MFWEDKSMLSEETLGSGKGENKTQKTELGCLALQSGRWGLFRRGGCSMYWVYFPCYLCPGLKAECWSWRVSACEQGIGRMAENTALWGWFCCHMYEWKQARCHVVLARTWSMLMWALHSERDSAKSQVLFVAFHPQWTQWSIPSKRWSNTPHLDTVNLPRRRGSHHFSIFLPCWSQNFSRQ